MCVGIYKPSFTSKSTVLARFAEAQFESPEWVMSFETGLSKENVFTDVSSNVVWKAHPRQSLSYTCNTRKR